MEAIEGAGYAARLLSDGSDRTQARLKVEGMICSSCSSKVEAALRAAPGVQSAAVSLITHKAEVRRLSRNAIKRGCKQIGLRRGLDRGSQPGVT